MNKNKKIILIISIIGIISIIMGITLWKTTGKTTSNSQQNSQKHKEELYKLLKKTDFKIEQNYIKSIEEFEYNKALGSYHIIFKNITNTTFDVYIDDVIETQIGKGEINEKKITINFDDTFISEIEKNPEIIKRFFSKIKKWINKKENFKFSFLQTNIFKNNLKKNTHFSSFFKKNKKEKKLIKDELKNLSKYFFNNNLLNIIKNIKKYNITFNEINEKTKSKDLSKDLFDKFNTNGRWIVNKQTITFKKIKEIKKFLEELKEIKTEVQKLISKKIKEICLNLEQQIIVLLNDEVQQILNSLNDGLLSENDFSIPIKLYKKFKFSDNSDVTFEMDKKTKEELQSILEFITYININKETIKTKINNTKLFKNIQTQINNKLNNIVKQILIDLNENNSLISVLPTNWNNEKKNLFKEFIFKYNLEVFFSIEKKTKDKLKLILKFVTYINANKENITKKIEFTNKQTQINNELNNIVKQILIDLNENNSLISVLPTNWNDEKKNLFKEFIFIDNTKVEFKIGEKTISKLQSILDFIIYINTNKKTIKTEINNAKLFKKRKNIETQINNILNNDIKIIFINLNEDNSLISVLPTNWNNKKKNLFKEFIFKENKKILFLMGEKTAEELQAILEFITYININKIIIWLEINNTKLLKEKQEIKNKIQNLLNDEVQQILNGLNDGLLSENDFSIPIKLYKKFKFSDNSDVTFEMGEKTLIQLSLIFNFINHINDNKIKILEKL